MPSIREIEHFGDDVDRGLVSNFKKIERKQDVRRKRVEKEEKLEAARVLREQVGGLPKDISQRRDFQIERVWRHIMAGKTTKSERDYFHRMSEGYPDIVNSIIRRSRAESEDKRV